jgi:hypothetical protein
MRAPIETARFRLECLGPAVLRMRLAHDYVREG